MNLTQEQEEMDRALKQYMEEEKDHHAEVARLNAAMYNGVEYKFGKKYSQAIFDCIMEAEGFGIFQVVETPKGNYHKEDWGEFDHIYVDQWQSGGMVGDDFAGDIYIPIPDGQYLRVSYQM